MAGYCEAQVNFRFNDLVRNPDLPGEKLHYMRGECAGIDLFQRMPEIEIERLDNEIKLRQQREEEHEYSKTLDDLDDHAP